MADYDGLFFRLTPTSLLMEATKQGGPARRLSRIPRVSDVLARDAVLDALKLPAAAA